MSDQAENDRHIVVVDNPVEHRFEARIDGRVALVSYIRNGDTVILTHTEVPKELQGRGLGNVLARGALDQTKRAGLSVIIKCPFLTKFVERHPEYRPVQGGQS
jgi:predicted GNAT family acetyltransferase